MSGYWKIDEPLNRFGEDDDENIDGINAPDWNATLVNRDKAVARHLILQFPRRLTDRAEAESIVQRVLDGLNADALLAEREKSS